MITAQFLLTAFVVVIAPGTGVVCTLAMGLGRGRRAAMAAAAGCTLGIVPAFLAAALGLAAILHASALAFTAMKLAGGPTSCGWRGARCGRPARSPCAWIAAPDRSRGRPVAAR